MMYLSANEINNRKLNGESITIIDIREPYEVEVASIGCTAIPMGEIVNHLEELRNMQQLVLMCRSGKRAESVANWLESEHGIPQVIVMEGGICQWKEQVNPSLALED
jgi:adenylyltransferase/sulfurtransferase